MAPKNKGVKLTLHELAQELGGETAQSFLPSQSSGIDRDRPERSEGEWRPDRGPRGDRDDRRLKEDQTNDAIDDDFDWRGGATRQTPNSRDTRDAGSSFRRPAAGAGGDDAEFSRDAMPSRSEMGASRTVSRGFESRGGGGFESRGAGGFESRGTGGFESRGGGGFDSIRSRDRGGDDVDFGDVRGGGARRLGGASTATESRPVRSTGLGTSSGVSNPWGRDSRSAAGTTTTEDSLGAWRGKERVDTRPEALKNKYKQRPATAAPTAGDSEAKPSETSAEPTEAATSSKPPSTPTAAASEISSTPPKEATPEATTPVAESKPSSPAPTPPTKTVTAVDRARGLLMESEPARPSFVRDEAPTLEPMVLKKRAPTAATSTEPYRPARRRPGASALEDLVKKKEAEAEAVTTPVQAQVDDMKSTYRKNMQEREQKRKEEEEKRRSEREEEETRQRTAMEKLMTGDPEKMKKLQGNIETGLQSGTDGKVLLSQFQSALTDDDLQSLIPSIVVAKCLVVQSIETLRPTWEASSTATDKQRLESVASLVRTLKPTLAFLFNKSEIRRHKFKFLLEVQRLTHAAGFPRVSEGLSLIEAIWDSLYMEDVIEEEYFDFWYEATDDDTPGRNEVLFQMLGWFNWLQNALDEGQAEVEDEDEDEEDDF